MPKTVLIIGANRGIGLTFARTFSKRGWNVVGSVRPQSKSDPSVQDLKETGARIVEVDYLDESTIIQAAKDLNNTALDVLINCAGVWTRPVEYHEHDAEIIVEKFRVMVVGPFLATKHFVPHLVKDAGGAVVNISSSSGSIVGNHDGTRLAYRMAKTSINQQTVTMALDFKRLQKPITMLALDPGWIKTKLSGWTGKVDINDAVTGMTNIIEKLTPDMSGQFLNWKEEKVPF